MSKFKTSNKLIAILIIFCMMFANYAVAGNNLAIAVAEELESQETITKGENVRFDAYLDSASESHEEKLNVEETQTLYLEVQVKDKVSISSAKIKIVNCIN